MAVPTVRIFLSSPSDLRPERAVALRLIARLDREFAHHFRVEAVMWEQEPLVASAHFQDPENIPPPSTTDIVVVMVWSRLGVFLPERFTGRLSGRQPVTGTEWEFEDALAAARAHRRPDLLAYRKTAPIATSLDDPELDTRRAAKHALDAFIAQWFRDGEGGYTAALRDVADEGELLSQLEAHLRALLLRRLRPEAGQGANQAPRLIQWHQGSPFRGLEVFEVEHEPVFFGRTRARIELRAALAHQAEQGCAFVLVAGASGCGKSSLVRAGLLSDLRLPGMIGNVALLRHVILRADDSAADPVAALAAALLRPEALPELAALGYDAAELAAQLQANPAQIGFVLRQAMLELHRGSALTERGEAKLLLVVDQLEALFTRDALTEAARARFVAVLEAAARSGSAFVVATFRSDLSDRIETLPALAALAAGRGRYTLLPPDAAEIGQIIRLPAREAGLGFEVTPEGAALDDALQQAAAGQGDSLPLLEFALQQLWERSQGTGGVLGWDAYRAMGELEGAIGARAEAELAALPQAAQEALPALLRALATVDLQSGRALSRRLPMATLAAGSPLRALAEAFLAARLLVAEEGGLLRVAHEALLTRWPRAAGHLAEDRRDLALRARLEAATALWAETPEGKRAQRLLPAGLAVEEAAALVARRSEMLERATRDFIAASVAAAAAATRLVARQRRRVRFGAAVAAAIVLMLGGGWWGREQRLEVARALERAETQAARASSEARLAAEATAERDRAIAARAEAGRQERAAEQAAALAEQRRAEAEVASARAEREAAAALDAQSRAETGFAAAREAANSLVFDLAQGLRNREGMPASLVRDLLDQAGRTLDALLARTPDDPATLRLRGAAHLEFGTTFAALGDTTRQREAAEQALRIFARLTDRDPGAVEWQRDFSMAHNRLGDVLLAQGEHMAALRAYRAGLAIRIRLTEHDPSNAEWQRDMFVSRSLIGDILREQGDLRGALNEYRLAMAVNVRLIERDPSNRSWLRDLAVGHVKIGYVLQNQNDLDGALDEYRASLAIDVRLSASEPTNTLLQRDLGLSHSLIGDVLMLQGKLTDALHSHREAFASRTRLSEHDAGNAEWQRDLLGSRLRLGVIHLLLHDAPQARMHAEAALALARDRRARFPDHSQTASDLTVAESLLRRIEAATP